MGTPNFRRKMRTLKQSDSSEKGKRGDPLGFLKLQFVAKYQKNQRDPLETFKIFESLTVPKKFERGTL